MLRPLLLVLALFPATLLAQRPVAGVVNGDTIWLDAFARDVGRRIEYANSHGTAHEPDVIEQAWRDEVDRRLIMGEARRRGITISDAEADSILLHEPPEYIKRGVQDAKGEFDPMLLEWMMRDPEGLVRAKNPSLSPQEVQQATQQVRESMTDLRSRFRDGLLRKRLQDQWATTFVVDSTALMSEYLEQSSTCKADVVMMPCATTTPPPTHQELERYWFGNKTTYTSARPMRRLAYLSFPLTPTKADTASMVRSITDFVESFRRAGTAASRDSILARLARMGDASERVLFSANDPDGAFYAATKSAQRGQIVGPILFGGGVSVVKVDSIRTGKNIARRVRRIVLPNDARLRSTSDRIRAAFTAKASFDSLQRAHSAEGNDANGIILLRGMLDPESERIVFGTKVGALSPAVNTGDASTMFLVLEESPRLVYVHAMTTAFQPSRATVDSVLRNVDAALAAYEGGEELGAVAQRFGKKIQLTPYFDDNAPVLGSYRLRDAAFTTQLAAACDPVETATAGVVAAVVADSVPAGELPFEACSDAVLKDWAANERCRMRAMVAQGMAAFITLTDGGEMLITESPADMKVVRNTTISYAGAIANVGTDVKLARTVYAQNRVGLLGPLQGDRGWYMVNVREITLGAAKEYPMFVMLRGNDAFKDQRDAAFAAFLRSLRDTSTIVDERWHYFRY
ncbi:MAG: SurA N-terminal domain-containing protein [Bacteroidetes bacterium]|nr:SurA N-terminal domain-containing protein [Bacteroidota bacterium]